MKKGHYKALKNAKEKLSTPAQKSFLSFSTQKFFMIFSYKG